MVQTYHDLELEMYIHVCILEPAKATPEPFANLSQLEQVCKSYVQGINVACTRVQDHSGQPGKSTAIRAFQILPGLARRRLRWAGHVSRMPMTRLL
jgi:hypothetical protein